MNETIRLFETARRDLLALWCTKKRLLQSVQRRFPESHAGFQAVHKLCHDDVMYQIRSICDESACRCSDIYGSELFKRVVDGVYIPAATHWFFGIAAILPEETVSMEPLYRTKEFNASDIELLEEVHRLGRMFIDSASALPFIQDEGLSQISRVAKKFEQKFARAVAQVEKYSRPSVTTFA